MIYILQKENALQNVAFVSQTATQLPTLQMIMVERGKNLGRV
jgi:hypothetical protein